MPRLTPEFRDWALEILNSRNDKEIEDRSKVHERQQKTFLQTQSELDNLTKMRYRDLIDDEAFLKEKKVLQSSISKLKEQLRETESRAEKWLESTEKTFNFAAYARKAFMTGTLETKKEILMTLGKKAQILNGKLTIEANEWFQPIKNDYPELEREYLRLEPNKSIAIKGRSESFDSLRTRLSAH